MIVGAPKANSTLNNYRTIIESGVVYSCSVGKAECNEIILDSEGVYIYILYFKKTNNYC